MPGSVRSRAVLALAAALALAGIDGAGAQISGNGPQTPAARPAAPPARPAAPTAAPAGPAPAALDAARLAPAALDAARLAWEARPMVERVETQTALVWTGDYSGALDGTFGRMTFEALAAFQARHAFPPDGILAAPARARLLETAARKRDGFGWRLVADPVTGTRLGLPTALLGKPTRADGGSRWVSADGRVEARTWALDGQDLAGLFERLKADAPDRRVTYAVLRADWFVVAETTAGRLGYTRFVRVADGLRGFTLRHDPAIGPEFGRVVVATAGTFEGGAAGAGAAAVAPQAAAPAQPGPAPAGGPTAPPAPPRPTGLAATGLVVAPGRVLTAADAVAECRALAVSGRPATVATTDAARRLALLAVDGLPAVAATRLVDAAPAAATPLTLVASGPSGLAVTGGETTARGVRAALQRGGLGAPALDVSGRLVGLVVSAPDERRLIAGLVPQATYDLADAEAIAAVLAGAGTTVERGPASAPLTSAAVLAALAPRLVTVACAR